MTDMATTHTSRHRNISGIDFGTVNLILALYDADGVKAAEVYASTNAWPAGEKVKFETGSERCGAGEGICRPP